MIEDIKVVQIYDWRYDEEAQKYIWAPTIYNLHIKLNGSWRPVEVEHLNPEPTTPEPEAEP